MKTNKNPKRFCEDAIWNHLKDGIENDRKRLSEQWKKGKINEKIKARYENNIRKLDRYEDEFINLILKLKQNEKL